MGVVKNYVRVVHAHVDVQGLTQRLEPRCWQRKKRLSVAMGLMREKMETQLTLEMRRIRMLPLPIRRKHWLSSVITFLTKDFMWGSNCTEFRRRNVIQVTPAKHYICR